MQLNKVIKSLTLMWGCLMCVALLTPPVTAQICDRTDTIEDLLLTALSSTDCTTVTNASLGALTGPFNWNDQSINNITNTDLDGLFNVTNINFANNTITALVNGTFAEVTAHTLNFSNNNISVIEQDALAYFGDAPFKLDWNFSNNAITSNTLASGFLVGKSRDQFPAISIFNLSHNNITAIQQSYFDGINVEMLDLSHNQIVNFPANTFDTIYLQQDGQDLTLDLNDNNITALATNSFSGQAWQNIYLANNQISSLGTNTFNSIDDVLQLDLSNNQITDFNASAIHKSSSGSQFDLTLSGNPLILKAGNFSGLKVRFLNIREMTTSTVPAHTFTGISNFDTIRMNNGNISILEENAFANAGSLTRLDISNNKLESIPSDLFGTGSNINRFYLQDNQIASIDTGAFAALTKLVTLDLSGNALATLQYGDFLGMYGTKIDISDNQLTSLPINLFNQHNNPSNIISFNIAGNQLTNDTWQITDASWKENLNGSVQLHLGHSIPIDINLNLTSVTGTLSPSTISIAAGSSSSQAVTWTPTNAGDLANFTVDIEQINVSQLSGYINIPSYESPLPGICGRTPIIRDYLLAFFNIACETVTAANLANAPGDFEVPNTNLTMISAIDLNGLTAVTHYDFSNNLLTELIDGIFSETDPSTVSFAHNNLSVIAANALVTSSSPDNNVDYNLSNNAITSTTLSSGFLNSLKSQNFPNKSFDLSYNNITTLERASFDVFTTNLNLSNNQIVDFAFDALYDLRVTGIDMVLDLSYNQLSNIAAQSLFGESLGQVDLSYNQIDTLAPEAVFSAVDLTRLDLGYNLISTFNASSINQTSSVNVELDLVLDGNPLVLTANNFFNLDLDDLYLRNANISEIPSGTFSDTTNVNVVYLNNNQISTVASDSFLGATGLDVLYLGNNSLSSIPNNLLAPLTELQKLDLSDNDLTGLSTSTFAGLNVTDINLSSNNITALPVNLLLSHADPAAITSFDISNNQLPANSWEITNVNWVEGANDEFTLQLDHALPSDINLNLTSETGTLNTSQITIAAGSTSSSAVAWTEGAQALAHIKPVTAQIPVADLSGFVMIPVAGLTFSDICDRTAAVQTAILDALNISACTEVTYDNLTQYSADTLDLTSLGLTTVNDFDIDYLHNVSAFDLSNNSLTNITNDTFKQVTPSLVVNLANNNIAVIEQNALLTSDSPDNNVDYNLSNNAITSTTLSSGFLNGLKSANFPNKSIDLSYNNITTLENSQLDIRSDNLNLSNNQITNLPATVFSNMRQSGHDMVVDLSYNQLTSIAAETILGETFAQVDLSNNQIDTLETNFIIYGEDLTFLDLGYNLISDFNASSIDQNPSNLNVRLDLVLDGNPLVLKANNFAGLDLDYVYIQNSNLTTIPADTFAGSTNINRIFLSRNNLTTLEAGAFSSAPGLDFLYLDNNQITSIPVDAFGTISSLTRIYLGINNLTAVQPNTFSSLTNLQTLSINSNQLIEVPVNMLGNNASLATFRLQDNNIANLSGISFSEYTSLAELNLGDNQIPTLTADNFKGMTATRIYLRNNQISSLPLNLLLEHNNPASITAFDLSGNPVADNLWQITPASWQENADGSVALYLEHSLPQDISFDVTSTTGNLNATTLTITAGSTSSQAVQWSATSAGTIAQIQAVNSQVAVPALTGYITVPEYEFNGICARDQAIVTAVLNALNIGNCQLVTVPDLSNLTNLLNVTAQGINQLTIDDLNGLLAVPTFDLSDNNLSRLVTDTFINTDPDSIILANNNIDVIAANALMTSTSPDNNVDYDLSNNAITSATLSSGFLNSLRSANFPNKSIDLSYNNITTLQRADLNFIADVINLSHNQIGNFATQVFHDTRLADLFAKMDLSYNLITSLPAETLAGETYQSADFSYNQIAALATNAIRFGERLTWLDLSYNQIVDFNASSIHQAAAKYGIKLDLILDANPLTLKGSNFNGLVLANLSLQNSGITTIPADTFAGSDSATNIDIIRLNSNLISSLASGSFSSAPGLDELYLNNNVIPTIPSDAFGALTDLNQLDLANNQLSTIGSNAFSQLTNLQTLDLSNNAFTTVPTDIFNSNNALQDLFLANNIISTVADAAFSDYTALVGLDLSSNALTSLSVNALQGLTATSIDLSDNQISVLPTNLLLNHTNPANITSFDLSGNLISSWEITQADWVILANTTVQLTIPHALPQAITVSFASSTGTLNASEVTILAGETSSEEVTWTGDAGSSLEIVPTNAQVSVATLSGYVRLNSISDLPTFGIAIGTQTVVAEHAFTALQLPLPSGGNAPFTYTLLSSDGSALPGNLVFNANNRQLNGTIAATGSYSLTYTATDADSDTANITFLLEVVDNLVPQFTATDALNFAILQNESTNITLPVASAGNGVVLYTIDTALPTGLSFNANTRTITGSSSVLGDHTFTYTAADSLDDNGDSLNVTISINPQLQPEFAASEIFNNITMRQDDPNFQLQLPAASGGNGVLSYSFTTDGAAGLPAGLFFDEATVSIQGTPQVNGEFNITVLVNDADITVINDSASFSFALTLVASLGFLPELPANFLGQSGQELSFLLPAGTGGVLPYTYSLTGTLPAGMSFDVNSRVLSGTTQSSGSFDLTYQVTDADNITFVATTQLITSSEAPVFLADVTAIDAQLGQSINVTLPAVSTDSLVSITYSVTGLPAGFSFDATTRQLSGSTTQLGEHLMTYRAVDPISQEASQMITLRIKANSAVLQDIMWRQALAIADQTVNSVKKRFALVNQHRLPYVQAPTIGGRFQGANFQVTDNSWLGLWLNSGSGSLSNNDNSQNASYNWSGSSDVTQLGIDYSGKDYLVGLMTESVSTSASFTVSGEELDYSGSYAISGLGLTSFYGGYYQPKYNVWAISSSGSGSAALTITAEGNTDALSTGVDYSMFAFGGQYKIDDLYDVGFEGITSASLNFADQSLSAITTNSASRNKFFGSIDFGKWTNKSAKPTKTRSRTRSRTRGRTTQTTTKTASAFKWSPKLALALRSDSGDGGSASGIETTLSVELEYKWINFEFGNRNFSSGNFSETGQWFVFHLIPTGKTGLNFTHSQQFGARDSVSDTLLSDTELTDVVSGMQQSDTVTSISKIGYGWNTKAGIMQLFSQGEASYADATAGSVFQTKADIKWEHIGLSYDSVDRKFSWNTELTGGVMDRYINNVDDTEQTTAISFKATVRF